jgi:hypothetical protein
MFGGIPFLRGVENKDELPPTEIIVAIPEGTLARHAMDTREMLDHGPVSFEATEDPISYYVDFLHRMMGIEVYESPPNNLLGLVPHVESADSWLLDIDVDFMYDFRAECYSPITNADSTEQKSMANVIQFIQKTRPETITISEAKVSAIRNPKSNFSILISRLRSLGYRIEERGVFKDDSVVVKGITDCAEFYLQVSKGLAHNLIGEDKGAQYFDDLRKAEEPAAKEFFRKRGYSM